MPLKASLEERRQARRTRDRAAYDLRLARGQCGRCGQPRPPDRADKTLCRPCTASSADRAWRLRQGRGLKRKGPAPTRGANGWNLGTDDLIAEHIALARKIAWRAYVKVPSSSSVDVDEMIGDGLLGLVVAGRTYDPSRQVPFGAWATTQIRGAIYDGMRRWTCGWKKDPPQMVGLREAEDGTPRYTEDE